MNLSDLLSKLKQQTSESQRIQSTIQKTEIHPEGNCLVYLTPEDESFAYGLKGMFGGRNTFIKYGGFDYLIQLEQYCTKFSVRAIASTDSQLLSQLVSHLSPSLRTTPKLDDYVGSLFNYKGIEIVFINPLKQLQTVPHGRFITSRFISKIVDKNEWPEATEFKWEILDETNISQWYEKAKQSIAIAADIETFKNPLSIRCISFTLILIEQNHFVTYSLVLSIDSLWALEWLRKWCALPNAKIFQNGKYDNSYLLRYSCPVSNWLWDTKIMFYCWYAELPKDLAFLNAFFLREVVYWKDLADTNDLQEYYRYNALDGWATANVFIQWMLSAPDWARRNYELKFPMVFPCLLAEMTGLERDPEVHIKARRETDQEEQKLNISLTTILGAFEFNCASSPQVVKMLSLFGSQAKDSSEITLQKEKLGHPLLGFLIEKILKIRELRKRRSTYLRTNDDAKSDGEGGAKEFCGRILYAINPDGTDTGRNSSREHHFWCGVQIQNITRGESVKQTFKASGDFYIGESDLEQAESRDTGYISGDTNLIDAVESPRDFHSINCSAFFGIPYDDIYDDATGKTKNKELRDLSKRTNHGATYNMGEFVLINTMGLDKIWRAATLLSLPFTDPKMIASYLLGCFDKRYPGIRNKETGYYAWVIQSVKRDNKLISRAFHHTDYNLRTFSAEEYINQGDWIRYCFADPGNSKSALNSYVAHPPQSLNARTLDEAFMRVFYELALPNPETFRLHAQIHDSILFSYSPERPDHAERVRELMEIPITIRDVHGITRKFVVPAALKIGKKGSDGQIKRAKYWSEIE